MKPAIFMGFSPSARGLAEGVGRILAQQANVSLWSEGVSVGGLGVLHSLSDAADQADLAVFVLAAPEDEPRAFPRENMIFELGYLLGRLGQKRTLVVLASSVPSSFLMDLNKLDEGINVLQLADLSHFLSLRTAEGADRWGSQVAAVIEEMLQSLGPRTKPTADYYSCFMSYAAADRRFVDRLYGDLSDVGVPCWLDAKDLRIGDRIAPEISRAIGLQDRLLLILSQFSISSTWVNREITRALEMEEVHGGTRLFPVRLDDSVFGWSGSRAAEVVRSRHIADFSLWQDNDPYGREFKRLIRDLSVTSSRAAEERAT